MKPEDLNEAIHEIDKSLVKEADTKNKSHRRKWISIGAAAASFIIVFSFITVYILKNSGRKNYDCDPEINYSDGIGHIDKSESKTAEADESIKFPEHKRETYYSSAEGKKNSDNLPVVSGLLTCFEIRDRDDLKEWSSLINSDNIKDIVEKRNILTGNAIVVSVSDGSKACFNKKVELVENGKILFSAVTDVYGNAFLFCGVSGEKENPDNVRVDGTDYKISGKFINIDVSKKISSEEKSDNTINSQALKLDLMIMLDTTGSMDDELLYLKEEIKDMISRITKSCGNIKIRLSVNFYRDDGDMYVIKEFDFSENIDECVKIITKQQAEGGGDNPEAVHTAIDSAVNNHNWDSDSVKICFFILDAPPHFESKIQGINSQIRKNLISAADKGIRFIPVLCSSSDKDTEYFTRNMAVITGGTLLCLTDTSGIGNSHLEPDAEKTKEEYLNDAMVRLVCEYCGYRA